MYNYKRSVARATAEFTGSYQEAVNYRDRSGHKVQELIATQAPGKEGQYSVYVWDSVPEAEIDRIVDGLETAREMINGALDKTRRVIRYIDTDKAQTDVCAEAARKGVNEQIDTIVKHLETMHVGMATENRD